MPSKFKQNRIHIQFRKLKLQIFPIKLNIKKKNNHLNSKVKIGERLKKINRLKSKLYYANVLSKKFTSQIQH